MQSVISDSGKIRLLDWQVGWAMVSRPLRWVVLINGVVQIVEGHLLVDPSTSVSYAGVNAGSAVLSAAESPGYDTGLGVSGRVVFQRTHQRTSAVTLRAKLNDYSFGRRMQKREENSRRAVIRKKNRRVLNFKCILFWTKIGKSRLMREESDGISYFVHFSAVNV